MGVDSEVTPMLHAYYPSSNSFLQGLEGIGKTLMLPPGPLSYTSKPRAGCLVSATSAKLVLSCQEESCALLHYNCCICPQISFWSGQDGPKTKGWTVGSGPKVLCGNNAPALISESPRSSRDRSLEESQMNRVVPTSGFPAHPQTQHLVPRTPPLNAAITIL